jgi:hypothetical protein
LPYLVGPTQVFEVIVAGDVDYVVLLILGVAVLLLGLFVKAIVVGLVEVAPSGTTRQGGSGTGRFESEPIRTEFLTSVKELSQVFVVWEFALS